MNKDKLIIKDGTEIELETGASLGSLGVLSTDKAVMVSTWDRLTAENLSEVQIKNGDGLVVGSYTGLVLVSETSTVQADGSILTCYNVREKTDIERLEERVAAVEEGQTVQDGAIIDTNEVLSAVVEKQEGGTV